MATAPTHQTVRLSRGAHRGPAEGMCAMELASVLAGESFSDRPHAVCPVIAAYVRAYNDLVDRGHARALALVEELAAISAGQVARDPVRVDTARATAR